jgi:hypothetical protein
VHHREEPDDDRGDAHDRGEHEDERVGGGLGGTALAPRRAAAMRCAASAPSPKIAVTPTPTANAPSRIFQMASMSTMVASITRPPT